jgi:hypothetical protein
MNQVKIKKELTYDEFLLVWLTRQGSNLDSSGPKPDVLPITPRVIPYCAFLLKTLQKYKKNLFCNIAT